jgi:hypothetical protein
MTECGVRAAVASYALANGIRGKDAARMVLMNIYIVLIAYYAKEYDVL